MQAKGGAELTNYCTTASSQADAPSRFSNKSLRSSTLTHHPIGMGLAKLQPTTFKVQALLHGSKMAISTSSVHFSQIKGAAHQIHGAIFLRTQAAPIAANFPQIRRICSTRRPSGANSRRFLALFNETGHLYSQKHCFLMSLRRSAAQPLNSKKNQLLP
jgi:hypothetical protein